MAVEPKVMKVMPSRRTGMFRALSHRNYRIFWIGAFLSNVGTWMQAVAQGWLVLQLTNSSFWLGLDGFMATAPRFLSNFAGGVFADLVDRRRLLLFTQVVAGLAAVALAILIWTDHITVWVVLAFSLVTGSCMAMAGPSYQAMTFDLVGREDLANAVALNSAQFQLSRVVGPILAGLGLQYFDLVGCFFLNGLSFVAVIVALRMVRFETKTSSSCDKTKTPHDFWQDLSEWHSLRSQSSARFFITQYRCRYQPLRRSLHHAHSDLRPRYFSTGPTGSCLDDGGRGRRSILRRVVPDLPRRLQTERVGWCWEVHSALALS